MQPRGSQCLQEHQTAQTSCLLVAVCPSVWGLLPCAREGFAAELLWLPGLRRLHTRRGSRDLSKPTQVPRAGPAPGRWEQRGCKRQRELAGQYKKAAHSVPLNICLLCNSYLQKHAKWHSAEVCLYLISLITLFPGLGLLNELSQFSWGGWNHLKTNFHFCFDGWSQPNLLLGWCIETPALYSPSTLLWPEPCFSWGQNDSCWSHNRGCDLAAV